MNPNDITLQPLPYTQADTVFQGALAIPPGSESPKPAVLVVHEWWGRTGFTDDRARALAALGFVGFSIDLYGNHQQAETPAEAAALSGGLTSNLPLLTARFEAALAAVKAHPGVDSQRIAAIGYCFGGSVALSMARQGVPLVGVVGFHAGVSPLAPIRGTLQTPVALFTGSDDPFVPNDAVDAVVHEMRRAGAEVQVTQYPRARHAFTNPQATAKGEQFGLPLAYDDAAASDSWVKAVEFLHRCFEGK